MPFCHALSGRSALSVDRWHGFEQRPGIHRGSAPYSDAFSLGSARVAVAGKGLPREDSLFPSRAPLGFFKRRDGGPSFGIMTEQIVIGVPVPAVSYYRVYRFLGIILMGLDHLLEQLSLI